MTCDFRLIELIGALFALLYLWLEIRQRPALWIVGIISSTFYVAIFYHGKFYADMALNGYYILAGVYGLWMWRREFMRRRQPQDATATIAVSRTTLAQALILAGIAAALTVILTRVLQQFTDSPVPFGDALTTALSIVAMWMLAHKLIEQWFVWLAVNLISTGLYFWRGLEPTAILYFIYSIASVIGYFQWKKKS
ncbi:MAG: nicotinamide riboside transporter PnuC [Prevotellaceae bacterium]|jgi:nicotinamide mononucleotide transporter|nr:nicotinamide riboside transporter PnuC [Prevotellaceae bacterium]